MQDDEKKEMEYQGSPDCEMTKKGDAPERPRTASPFTIFDLVDLAESLPTSVGSMAETLSKASSASKRLYSTVGAAIQMASALSNYTRTIDWPSVALAFDRLQSLITEAVKDIKVPNLSEEQKQEMLAGHRAWGEMGWTSNPLTDGKLFDITESDRKKANQKALKSCTNSEMHKLFQRTAETKRCKKTDYAEAVFDFENKKYKSCSLVLCSLIEAILIRLQKRPKDPHKRRSTGIGAIEKAEARAKVDDEEKQFFMLIFQANLFQCLRKIFENTHDFQQTSIINRNLLDHGMMTRRVTRKDCVQLFLLYYNMLDLLDFIYR